MAAPNNTVPPVLTGTPAVGETLSVTNGTWVNTPSFYAYSWERVNAGGVPTVIAGAVQNAYIVQSKDVGYTIRAQVAATEGGSSGGTGYAYSNATDVVPSSSGIGVFTVEDGTGLTEANSYASVEDADAYHAFRNRADWLNATLGDKERCLVEATDFMELRYARKYLGDEQFPDNPQRLSYPRTGIGYDSQVPLKIQQACAEYALRALSAPLMKDPTVDPTGLTLAGTKKKVGPIETETRYTGTAVSSAYPSYPFPDGIVKPFLGTSGGRLVRA